MKKLFILLFLLLPIIARADNNADAAITNAKLGLLYLQKAYYSAAKKSLLRAIHDDPRIASPWYSMGYFLEKTGHTKSAARYYQYAIKIDPHSGDAKNNYGIFLCRYKQYQSAIHEFMSAVREPNYLYVASAYKNAGICALKIPNQQWARYFFKKAEENNPKINDGAMHNFIMQDNKMHG